MSKKERTLHAATGEALKMMFAGNGNEIDFALIGEIAVHEAAKRRAEKVLREWLGIEKKKKNIFERFAAKKKRCLKRFWGGFNA